MAQIPTLEAAPGQEGVEAPKKKGKLGLILALAAVIVLGGGGAAAYFMLSGSPADKKDAAGKEKEHPKGPALYVALDPPFVVNFEAEQLVRFLQVTVQVMSRDQATVDVIKANDPVVRNEAAHELDLLREPGFRESRLEVRPDLLEAPLELDLGLGRRNGPLPELSLLLLEVPARIGQRFGRDILSLRWNYE